MNMQPEQALSVLEAAISAAIAAGAYKSLNETNAIAQALHTISETIKQKNHVQKNSSQP